MTQGGIESGDSNPFPTVTDNGETIGAGCPTLEESNLCESRARLRESLCHCLAKQCLVRLSSGQNVMNDFGHVHYNNYE
jgi:hypothetical protein